MHLLKKRMGGPQSRSVRFVEVTNALALPGIEIQFFGPSAFSLVTIQTEISWLQNVSNSSFNYLPVRGSESSGKTSNTS